MASATPTAAAKNTVMDQLWAIVCFDFLSNCLSGVQSRLISKSRRDGSVLFLD